MDDFDGPFVKINAFNYDLLGSLSRPRGTQSRKHIEFPPTGLHSRNPGAPKEQARIGIWVQKILSPEVEAFLVEFFEDSKNSIKKASTSGLRIF
jgi:hypothetical protein